MQQVAVKYLQHLHTSHHLHQLYIQTDIQIQKEQAIHQQL